MESQAFSEKADLSFQETLTKFNLTNYKSVRKGKIVRHINKMNAQEFNSKQLISNKSKQFKDIRIKVNKVENKVPVFQTLDFEAMIRKRKKKSKSEMKIQVTSRCQKSLIQFMNPQNLPKIQIKNRLKRSQVQKIIQVVNNEDKFRKFTQSYFRSLQKTKKQLQARQISEQFQQIKVLGWSVKGYVINQNLILKAVKLDKKTKNVFLRKKIQKFKKLNYNEEIKQKVRQDYKGFVKDWLYLEEILNSYNFQKK